MGSEVIIATFTSRDAGLEPTRNVFTACRDGSLGIQPSVLITKLNHPSIPYFPQFHKL